MKAKYNKGFTLVELLSVIALLATLAIIVMPNIDKLLRNSKEDLYSKQISFIKTAARLWCTEPENMILLEQNEVWPFTLTLSDLQESGFIEKDIKDPETDEKFSENLLIYINKENDKYVYSINELSNDPLSPTIVISGDKIITLEIGSDYTDLGAIATTTNGNNNIVTTTIKKNGVVSNIDKNTIGTYIITYSSDYIVDDIVHTGIATRILKFVDTTKPIITCSSCVNGTIIESTDIYSLPSVLVTDNSGENLTAVITGSFSSKIPGNKTVIYQATDSSGNTGILEISYIVKDTIAPTFIYSMINTNTVEIIASDNGSGVKEYSFDSGETWQKNNYATIACGKIGYIKVRDYVLNEASKQISIKCFKEWDFAYTGDVQEFIVPDDGWYQVELWGAQGAIGTYKQGGKGAYTSGKIYLNSDEILNIYVGEQPLSITGGYNGGGNGTGVKYGLGGGGATDIRFDGSFLNDRIMVAGGGGGSYNYNATFSLVGGNAGGLVGKLGKATTLTPAVGGTQTVGGLGNNDSPAYSGQFGIGGSPGTYGAGGGGGYYGGGGTYNIGSSAESGAGGSSFISGYAGVNAIESSSSLTPTNNTIHYSTKYFIDGEMEMGVNSGNGKAKITYLSETKPQRVNTKLDNIRYVKDCINGNTVDANNHWVELQAIHNGVNLAKGKIVTGIANNISYSLSRITDGDINSAYAMDDSNLGLQCIILDLGMNYDLDEIAVWHDWADGKTYNSNTTYVSSDNINWATVINTIEPEVADGKRASAYSINYGYNGSSQTFTANTDGWYQIELWGAQGGDSKYTAEYIGGQGGYSSGKIYLTKGQNLYIYVGGGGQKVVGTTSFTLTANGNGYNGGAVGSAAASNSTGGGGGGATDIRLVSGDWNNEIGLKSRIMVAGGGGGSKSHKSTPSYSGTGGGGGSLIAGRGISENNTCYAYGTGGSQISGGISTICLTNGQAAETITTNPFGVGLSPYLEYTTSGSYSGGGGGYYGGGAGFHAPAGGGSSFISGYAGVNAIESSSSLIPTNNTIHYSERYFVDGEMESGVKSGNGKAKITYFSETKPQRVNTKLDNVRYVKDCINGNTVDSNNHWVELQAIHNGVNLAKGKKVTGIENNASYPLSRITDGDITSANYAMGASTTGLQCIILDLEMNYDLDEIAVWHDWDDGKTYNSNTTYVSSDNINWATVINMEEPETSNGKRVSVYHN